MTSTRLNEHTELDINLDNDVPCSKPDCDAPATWLAVARHVHDNTPCGPWPYCGTCRNRIDAMAARVILHSDVLRLMCKQHRTESAVSWWKL